MEIAQSPVPFLGRGLWHSLVTYYDISRRIRRANFCAQSAAARARRNGLRQENKGSVPPPRASQRGSGEWAYVRERRGTCPPRASQRGSGETAYVRKIRGSVTPPPRASQRGSGETAYVREIKGSVTPPRASQRGSGETAYVREIKGSVTPPAPASAGAERRPTSGKEGGRVPPRGGFRGLGCLRLGRRPGR